MTALKQEMHRYIDCIPENELVALKPLLLMLSNKSANDTVIVESDLTEEELVAIADGEKQIANGDFVDFDDYLKERGIVM